MEASFASFSYTESASRMRELLDSADNEYVDSDTLPSRSQLTFSNGFYIKCTAMFVDIRGSKKLQQKHTRPVLAKIYRAYVSELVAVMRYNTKVSEVTIEGDCVWGLFDTPLKADISQVFEDAARISSLIDILNWRLRAKGYSELTVGIGISYGSALMVKAGAKNSGINDVVYMGDVVGDAARLCALGNSSYGSAEIYVANDIYTNLEPSDQQWLHMDYAANCYCGNVVNTEMNTWLKAQI